MEMGGLMPVTVIRLARSQNAAGELVVLLGVRLLDEYLEFLGGQCRPNTVLAVAYDSKVCFTVVKKTPRQVRTADVPAFMTAQRTGGEGRLQIAGPDAGGMSARTLRRRVPGRATGGVPRDRGGPVLVPPDCQRAGRAAEVRARRRGLGPGGDLGRRGQGPRPRGGEGLRVRLRGQVPQGRREDHRR